MWLVYAVGSAFFAGITAILAKSGIKNTDSDVATAIRTAVVLLFSLILVVVSGCGYEILNLNAKTWIFLILSGLSTGASWLYYFKALQKGDINRVVSVDKLSTVLTLILAFIFFNEKITWLKAAAIVLIGIGTYLMIDKKRIDKKALNEKQTDIVNSKKNKSWFFYAVFSMIFASLTAILGKVGINGVNSNLGTAIRTAVVLILAWGMVFAFNKQKLVKQISKKELTFICLSGIATGGSWLCYYKALKEGLTSVVVAIDKLSILITVAFSFIVFKEKLSFKALCGLIFMVLGTLLLIV